MSTRKKMYGIADREKKDGPLTVGRFLTSWRLSEDLSQKEFAKMIGMSSANLCDIEKGRKGLSIDKASEIAKKIGYSPTALVQLQLQEQVEDSGLNYTVELKKRIA